jgi:hypothetical protein
MKLIPAIALDRPREVSTKYGQRLVIDAMVRDTGERITLWRGSDDDYSRRYVIKNSPITVGVDSKGKHTLIENESLTNLGQPLPESPVPVKPVHNYDHKIEKTSENDQSTLSPNQKREIAQYVGDMADLFNFCLKTVDQRVENITPDDRRQVATSLFIATQKRFNI